MAIIQGHASSSGSAGFYDYPLAQSARISKADSASIKMPYSSKGTATDLLKFTFSGWVKRGAVGDSTFHPIITAGNGALQCSIVFTNVDRIEYIQRYSSNIVGSHYTTAVFRDPSAWYHVVVAYDAANATAADRCKIYVNGILQDITVNNAIETTRETRFTNNGNTVDDVWMGYGFRAGTAYYSEMYRTEFHMIDGQTLDPTYFGEWKNDIWIPKAYSGTYGNNGFYIDFSDVTASAGSITSVNDSGPNGLDFSVVSSVEVSDIVPDSPTNNFCTMNSVNKDSVIGLSEGNLEVLCSAANQGSVFGTFAPQTGKWYWEVLISSNSRGVYVIMNSQSGNRCGLNIGNSSIAIDIYEDNATTAITAIILAGDIIGFAFDYDAKTFEIFQNGSSLATGAWTNTDELIPAFRDASGATFATNVNFGQDSTFAGNKTSGSANAQDANGIGDFYHSVPSGYLALCTSNLPDPVIDPAQDATPEDHFNVITYTGDGTYPRSITGVGFQPDFTWVKARSAAYSHILYDAVRGAGLGNELLSNSTAAEGATQDYANLTSFDSDGFSVGSTTQTNVLNASGVTFVGWNWKAGGTGVSNTDGSITSTVSANTDAGFSIVGYTGLGPTLGDGSSIGHGLNQAPELVIFKNRSATSNWFVMGYPTNPNFATDGSYLLLEDTAAMQTSTGNEIEIGDSVITFIDSGTTIADANPMIAYCFHSVDGFSKVGSYVGNGSTDGPFVYTGFRPKWLMVKEANGASNWMIVDAARDTYNVLDSELYTNSASAEATSSTTSGLFCDFTSNGFKLRTSSGAANQSSSYTYIYLAFAEQPFKYSNAR